MIGWNRCWQSTEARHGWVYLS